MSKKARLTVAAIKYYAAQGYSLEKMLEKNGYEIVKAK